MAERFQIVEGNLNHPVTSTDTSSLITHFEETLDIDQMLGRIFDVFHHRDGIRPSENTLPIDDQNGQGEAEEYFRAFQEKTIPNPEKGLEWDTVDENRHEPVQGQRGDLHFVHFEMLMNVRCLVFNQVFQHELIDLSTDQTGIVIVVQLMFSDGNEKPKGIFWIE